MNSDGISCKIKGDAAIALISTTSLALGVMVISMTTGMNTDVYNYMFGSILAMSAEDVRLSVILAGIVLVSVKSELALYRPRRSFMGNRKER